MYKNILIGSKALGSDELIQNPTEVEIATIGSVNYSRSQLALNKGIVYIKCYDSNQSRYMLSILNENSVTYKVQVSANSYFISANNKLFVLDTYLLYEYDDVNNTLIQINLGVSTTNLKTIKYMDGVYYIFRTDGSVHYSSDLSSFTDTTIVNKVDSVECSNNKIYAGSNNYLHIYDDSFTLLKSIKYSEIVTDYYKTNVLTDIKVKGNNIYIFNYFNDMLNSIKSNSVYKVDYTTEDITTICEYLNYIASKLVSDDLSNKQFAYYGTNNTIIVDYSDEDNITHYSLYTAQTERKSILSVHKELKVNYVGVGFNATYNADNVNSYNFDSIVLINEIGKNYTITITAQEHYQVTGISSVNGVVSGNTITYSSDNLYQEDTITIDTIPDYENNGGLEITGLDDENASALSSDFSATCDGYIIYDGEYIDITDLTCFDGSLSVTDSEENTITLFSNGEYVEEWSGILVGELHFLSSAFYNKISSFALAQYYRNVKFNEPTYDTERGTYTKWESSATKKITTGETYFVYSKTGINIQYTFAGYEGYKVDSITSNYGTISTNKVTITSLNDDAEINIECEFVGATFQIILCHLQDENDVFNKRTTNNLTVNGSLVENSSIINPTILFELSGCPSYNYCKISSFNRCYYITDVQNVGFNLWMISLEVDEIESFKNDIINNTTGLVERSNYKYDSFIDDNLEPKKANLATSRTITLAPAILKANGTVDHLQTNLIDCKHYSTQNGTDVRLYYNIAVTLSNCDVLTHSSQVYDDIDGVGDVLQPLRVDYNDTSLTTFVFSDMLSFESFMYTLNYRHKDSYVVSAYKFPFNLVKTISYYEDNNTQRSTSDGIINGHDAYQLKVGGDVLKYDTNSDYTFEARGTGARLVVDYVTAKYFHYADIKITNPTDYTDYNATYKLNIPYYGDIELSRETLFNANKEGNIISIYYCVDLQLGNCKVILVDKAHNNIILEQSVNMAIELPYNFDTSEENRNRIEMKRVNIAVDSARNIFNGIGSGMALNINGLGNSTFSLMEQQMNYKREMGLMYPTAYSNKFSGALANYTNKNIILTKIKKESNLDVTTKTIYADEKGIPCNKYTNSISTDFLYGFTGDLLFLKFSFVNIKSLIATNREIESIKSALMSGIKYRINNS